jgi:oxygen-independent coproporphyrinogen-3 oxidase
MRAAIQENPISTSHIGWYLHLPFCRTKCGYCDFYSLPTIPALIGDLVRSLLAELRQRAPQRPVETIFIGGGTPTELPHDALETLLAGVAERAGSVREWTVEANPTSAPQSKLEILRRWGVNRVSFGAQSFRPDELKTLERLHDPRHVGESVRAARALGFENVSLDLIYAIPGRKVPGAPTVPPQTLSRWRESLRQAIDLDPDHLSCYGLMYEPGTALTRSLGQGQVIPCADTVEADMFEMTIEELTAAGFDHYEISNYARPGRRCRANVIYWNNQEYLGIGPSAVSYLDGLRQKNIPDVRSYVRLMQSDPTAVVIEREQLAPLARACETAVQMLRMTRGIDLNQFQMQTGFDAHELFARPIRQFSDVGLLESDDRTIHLTRRGLLLANRVMADFLIDPPADEARVDTPGTGRSHRLTVI